MISTVFTVLVGVAMKDPLVQQVSVGKLWQHQQEKQTNKKPFSMGSSDPYIFHFFFFLCVFFVFYFLVAKACIFNHFDQNSIV